MCNLDCPSEDSEPLVRYVNVRSGLDPEAEIFVYEFRKAATYDITVSVRKDATDTDPEMAVHFEFSHH